MAQTLHIAISAEKLFSLGGLDVSNTLFTSYLVTILFLAFLLYANRQLKSTARPTGLQNLLEMMVEGLYGLVEGVAGKTKKALTFAPIISAFLLFILLNNWIEHIPGFHTIEFTGKPGIELVNVPHFVLASPAFASTVESVEHVVGQEVSVVEEAARQEVAEVEEHAEELEEGHEAVAFLRGANADLNMTMALALISVGLTQFFGVKFAGLGYFKKFINFSSPIGFFVGLLELISEFSKIISFAFRLFGNIFAGEVLIGVMTFLIPVFLPIPFIGFELFIGALQAYVFAMLSLVFFTMAADEHAHH